MGFKTSLALLLILAPVAVPVMILADNFGLTELGMLAAWVSLLLGCSLAFDWIAGE